MVVEIIFIDRSPEKYGTGVDQTGDPWICCLTHYRLHFGVRY